jgi:carboxylate-amine ligase
VLLAALMRALVETEIAAWERDEPYDPPRPELLRLAKWQAARTGIEGQLLHPHTGKPTPAPFVIAELLNHVTPVLEEWNELDATRERLEAVMERGTGARVQRDTMKETNDLTAVMREAVRQTLLDVDGAR